MKTSDKPAFMRILVVDDHKLFADGLGFVLRSMANEIDLIIVNDSQSALSLIESYPSLDLLILDINMPGIDGLSLLTSIKERQALIPSVIVSATEDILKIKQAFELGAFGFVPKSYDSVQLIEALKISLSGKIFVPDDIEQKISRLKQEDNQKNSSLLKVLNQFGITKRQHEVLKLLAKGYSNQQIASVLYLSKHTVKSHVAALLSAFQAENRTDCVRQGRECGLIN